MKSSVDISSLANYKKGFIGWHHGTKGGVSGFRSVGTGVGEISSHECEDIYTCVRNTSKPGWKCKLHYIVIMWTQTHYL